MDIRYLAGLIDGEGCISVGKQTRKDMISPYYHLRISIEMTSKEVINKIYQHYGGSLHKQKNRLNRKAVYTWSITGKYAYELLSLLIPYLIIKRQEAILGKEFFEEIKLSKGKWHKITREENIQRDSYYQMMKDLKRGIYI